MEENCTWRGHTYRRTYILWSLELASLKLASEFFHDFAPMILARKTRIQLSLPGQNSRNSAVTVGKVLEWREVNLVMENARSGMKEVVSGILIEIPFLLSAFLISGQLPQSFLNKKSNDLLHKSPNPILSVWSRRRGFGSNTVVFILYFVKT